MVIRVLPRLNDNNDGDDSIIYIYAAATASSSTKAADNDDKNEDDEEGMNIINAVTAYYRLMGHVVHHDDCPSIDEYIQNHGIVDNNNLQPLASIEPSIVANGLRALHALSLAEAQQRRPPLEPSAAPSVHGGYAAPVAAIQFNKFNNPDDVSVGIEFIVDD